MESTLWQTILNYGALGVLTVLFFLFSKGYIVSKVTLDQSIAAHKATIERILTEDSKQRKSSEEESAAQRVAYEKTINMIAVNHTTTINQIMTSYQTTISELKEIIEVVKNGSKKSKQKVYK